MGLPITDLIGGATAALGVVSALYRRQQTGKGAYLDLAMLDAAASWLGYFPQHKWHNGSEPPRSGLRHQYLCPCGPYLAADGRYVNVALGSAQDWERFAVDVLRRPDWLQDPIMMTTKSRSLHRDEAEARIEQEIAKLPSAVWFERLRNVHVPFGEVRDMTGVLHHPQLEHRQMFVTVDSPIGELPIVRSPLGSPDAARRLPGLGEHTTRILEWLEVGSAPTADAASDRTGHGGDAR